MGAIAIVLVGLLVEASGLLLHIIGLGTPEWSVEDNNEELTRGLWECCNMDFCFDWPTKGQFDGQLEATEAFAIIGLIAAIAAVVFCFLFLMLPFMGKESGNLATLLSMICAVFAFICILISVIIWGAGIHDSSLEHIGYSFGLSITGGILLLLGGPIAFVGGKKAADIM